MNIPFTYRISPVINPIVSVFVVCLHVLHVEDPVVLCLVWISPCISLFESLLFSSPMMVLLICCIVS